MLIRRTLTIGIPGLALFMSCGWPFAASASVAAVHATRLSGRASNLIAQSDLKEALAAAKAQYRQFHNFSQAAPPELEQYNAKLIWLAPDTDAVATGHQVGVSNGGDNANQNNYAGGRFLDRYLLVSRRRCSLQL